MTSIYVLLQRLSWCHADCSCSLGWLQLGSDRHSSVGRLDLV